MSYASAACAWLLFVGVFAEAMAALPARRNAVWLVDPAAALALAAPLLGLPKLDPVSPGPPIAVSLSLTGEPARIDVHIPARAIQRYLPLQAPAEPM